MDAPNFNGPPGACRYDEPADERCSDCGARGAHHCPAVCADPHCEDCFDAADERFDAAREGGW